MDPHFLERGRFSRLMEVGATNPEHLGVGLGEDAAVLMMRSDNGRCNSRSTSNARGSETTARAIQAMKVSMTSTYCDRPKQSIGNLPAVSLTADRPRAIPGVP